MVTKDYKKFKSSMLTRTLKLLKKNRLPLTAIESDTGLNAEWLSLLRNDKIPHPSVVRIEFLYNYLTGTKLKF